MSFDPNLLEILACPVCKGKLVLDKSQPRLVCRFDRLAYPISEGIPILLETKASKLSSDDLEQIGGHA